MALNRLSGHTPLPSAVFYSPAHYTWTERHCPTSRFNASNYQCSDIFNPSWHSTHNGSPNCPDAGTDYSRRQSDLRNQRHPPTRELWYRNTTYQQKLDDGIVVSQTLIQTVVTHNRLPKLSPKGKPFKSRQILRP